MGSMGSWNVFPHWTNFCRIGEKSNEFATNARRSGRIQILSQIESVQTSKQNNMPLTASSSASRVTSGWISLGLSPTHEGLNVNRSSGACTAAWDAVGGSGGRRTCFLVSVLILKFTVDEVDEQIRIAVSLAAMGQPLHTVGT
jgi:hypothetical protein